MQLPQRLVQGAQSCGSSAQPKICRERRRRSTLREQSRRHFPSLMFWVTHGSSVGGHSPIVSKRGGCKGSLIAVISREAPLLTSNSADCTHPLWAHFLAAALWSHWQLRVVTVASALGRSACELLMAATRLLWQLRVVTVASALGRSARELLDGCHACGPRLAVAAVVLTRFVASPSTTDWVLILLVCHGSTKTRHCVLGADLAAMCC